MKRTVIVPDFTIENHFNNDIVAGVDEAGRGCWAGPVVAAAVILDRAHIPNGLNDSKKLSSERRELLYSFLESHACIGVGIANEAEIEAHNILAATKLAMQRAVTQLRLQPTRVLVDGNQLPLLPMPAEKVVQGDAKSLSIAAASIIAKVTRDRLMDDLAQRYPYYGWHANKGYGTAQHQQGILSYGLTPHHRLGYAPIKHYAARLKEKNLCQALM